VICRYILHQEDLSFNFSSQLITAAFPDFPFKASILIYHHIFGMSQRSESNARENHYDGEEVDEIAIQGWISHINTLKAPPNDSNNSRENPVQV
jgi:hypothetical protein